MDLKVKLTHPDAVLPTRESILSAGVDLYACEGYKLDPGERKLVRTGLQVAIPHGFYGRLTPLSGPALKHGIDVMAGVVNSDYHDELRLILINHGTHKFIIAKGDPVAQLIVEAILTPEIVKVADLDIPLTGGGFGALIEE